MIDFNNMRQAIVKGLSAYLGCPVIRSNQNAPLPPYPFISYTVTRPMNENKGTYGEYEDGTARKSFTQTWSITALSDDNLVSVELATKAREWFDFAGTLYFDDNDIDIQSVGGVTNRDNVLTVEYEYKNGFDVFFTVDDVINIDYEQTGWIEEATINQVNIQGESYEEIIDRLNKELAAAYEIINIQNNALNRIKVRLGGDSL